MMVFIPPAPAVPRTPPWVGDQLPVSVGVAGICTSHTPSRRASTIPLTMIAGGATLAARLDAERTSRIASAMRVVKDSSTSARDNFSG
jgi:hypothetical protein